tara:strand:+ start:32 stop:1039 length:1008 start_codon:yes stop_codon:yes gene_type:complete
MNNLNFNKLNKTFIVAEIGVNHEGDVNCAKRMIDLAAKSGVDAVKFQTFTAENYVSRKHDERFKRVKKFELNYDDFSLIQRYAKKKNIIFFSTPLHPKDIDTLKKISPIIKISSGDLTYLDLIKNAALTNKPLILSTGLGDKKDIKNAVSVIEQNRPNIKKKGELLIMHCVAAYPTPENEVNLKNIEWLKQNFNYPVGYSDHTLGIKACELAVAYGAVVIEKHFTYRKENQVFHDHKISADKKDMTELVNNIRNVEKFSGSYERKIGKSEKKMFSHLRRSVYARRNIPEGKIIEYEDIILLRPAKGYGPENLKTIIGKKAKKFIKIDSLIKKIHL